MPITTHTVETSNDATRDRHVVLRLHDQDGNPYMSSFWLAADADLPAMVAVKIADINAQLAEQEFEQLVGAG